MTRSEKAERYWAQFLESLLEGAERPSHYYDVFYFGISKEASQQITPLVLDGTKTATGSVQWVYEAEGKRPPRLGDYSIVTDGDDPVCIIRDMEVRVIPYEEVDETFAWDGGEEDRSLANWRRIYWEYITLECARIQREPTAQVPIVCERFHVVYKEPLQRD